MIGTKITVYMKADASQHGKQHEHNNASIIVHERYIRIRYNQMKLAVNYPLAAIEKWDERTLD